MIYAWTAADIRVAEDRLLAQGAPLMDRAAFALDCAIRAELRARRTRVRGARVVLLVGSGNNGGDALFAAARLARHGVTVTAVACAAAMHSEASRALRDQGGRILDLESERQRVDAAVSAADLIVDAIVGIGARGPLRGRCGEFVAGLARQFAAEPWSRPYVVAVDVPSGVGVADGTLPGPALHADRTITFGGWKPCLMLAPAARLAGAVTVVDIGLGLPHAAQQPAVHRLTDDDLAEHWPTPGATDHKYTRGVLGVLAGSSTYPGAAVLTVSAAVATGVGMVRYVGPASDAVLAARPEAVTAAGRVQAWVIGPGTDDEEAHRQGFARVIRDAIEGGTPVVLDAGALSAIHQPVPPWVVLTPHAGELAAFLRARKHDVTRSEIAAEPWRWALRAHHLTGATVLLKGDITVVVGHGGTQVLTYAQPSGSHWSATAGSGDVLAGIVGGALSATWARADLAGTAPDAMDVVATVAASVHLHARAGQLASAGGPVTALGIAQAVPTALAGLIGGRLAGRGMC